ncbi:MAG: response regulator transcription factor [Chloroflexota bacterium]|nr:response regulator transcription factor [Chloroflexota bacterium]
MDRQMNTISTRSDIVDAIKQIGDIKNELSLRDRSLISVFGLYVQRLELTRGVVRYIAGGRFRKKLIFDQESDGTISVKKYRPDLQKKAIEPTLRVAQALERKSRASWAWSDEKQDAYWAPEVFDVGEWEKVIQVASERHGELNEMGSQLNERDKQELVVGFINELEHEWPTEFLELAFVKKARETTRLSVLSAYQIGYMVGRGWISTEESTNWTLWAGNRLADVLRSNNRKSECRAIAFSCALQFATTKGMSIASEGYLSDSVSDERETIRACILHVDDDPVVRKFVRDLLELYGHEMIQAEDGEAALDAIERYSPDLIILDNAMPGMYGIEVVKQVRKTSKVPIIMLTVNCSDLTWRIDALNSGANDCIPTPFEVDELLFRVENVLRQSRRLG